MALALLEWADADDSAVRFRVDIGTNTQHELKIGGAVSGTGADEQVDDVYFTTDSQQRDADGPLFASAGGVAVPRHALRPGRAYAQLFSSKAGGRAQARSDVVPIPGASLMPSLQPPSAAREFSRPASLRASARRIPHRTQPLSRPASVEALLGEIVKVAAPIVMGLLKAPAGAAPDPAAAPNAAAGGPTALLMQVLQSVLAAIGAPAVVSKAASRAGPAGLPAAGNRYLPQAPARFARPFIFGIDDALIASLVGPVLQILPQLMNAANQKRIELKKADNALIAGIVSDTNKRLMMEKLLDAQKAAQAQGPAAPVSAEQLKAIADLLGQLPTDAAAPVAVAKSLTAAPAPAYDLSSRALVDFTFGAALAWNGRTLPLFDRSRTIVLHPRLNIAEPAPKTPLAKAILLLVLHDPLHPEVRVEKTFKLHDVAANTMLDCAFEPAELSHLPPNAAYTLLAQLRWRQRSGRETRALGASEIVLVERSFVKERGAEMSAERELVDMAQHRAFWNKVWEAPLLDNVRAADGERRKYLWDLSVQARCTVLLSARHDANALMETRLLAAPDDAETLTRSVRGRMKAGIELTLAELNRLMPLWDGAPPLEAAQLEALAARPFLDAAARECRATLKLKGRAGEAGMVWMIPTFKRFGVTLSAITEADGNGQVSGIREETIQFPLPVAMRLVGVKSTP